MPEMSVRKALLETVRQSLHEALVSQETVRLEQALESTLAQVETGLLQLQTPQERAQIACAAGCGTCCVVNVGVLYPEAVRIVRHLQASLSETELRELSQRLEQMYHQTVGLDDEERLFLRKPCLFLDAAQRCSIYPVRPILCRSVTSADAEDCHDALTSVVLGEERAVLMNLIQKDLWEEVFALVGEELEEAGLEGRSQRLVAALYQLLPQPRPAQSFWAGESWPPL